MWKSVNERMGKLNREMIMWECEFSKRSLVIG
jgi:hypothetical protein